MRVFALGDIVTSCVQFTSLALKNFRNWKLSGDIPLAPLTLVVGPNSAGKSSLTASIGFLDQSGLLSLSSISPIWSGRLAKLGSYDDAVFGHKKDRNIEISVRANVLASRRGSAERTREREMVVMESSYLFRRGRDAHGYLSVVESRNRASNTFLRIARKAGAAPNYDIHYGKRKLGSHKLDREGSSLGLGAPLRMLHRRDDLSKPLRNLTRALSTFQIEGRPNRVGSDRHGPRRTYPKKSMDDTFELFFGRGEAPQATPQQMLLFKHISRPAEWNRLKRLLTDLGIADDLSTQDVSPYATAIKVRDPFSHVWMNLADVGFGASQVIPIIFAARSFQRGPLILEQPEVHLHPKAQERLGEYLVEVSHDRQLFIETHSVHIVNAVRHAVATNTISPSHVQILYVGRPTGCVTPTATPIGIDERGNFTREWPDGFFGERYASTMKIAAAASEVRAS